MNFLSWLREIALQIIGSFGSLTFWRGNVRSKSPAAHATPVPDATPDAFLLTDVSNVPLNTVETSNAITVSGLGSGVVVTASISGASSSQMQQNGGDWVSGPLTVENGDTLVVRHTSAGANSIAVNTILTVGGVSNTFTSTTLAGSGAPAGGFDFNLPSQSALIILLEDI